VADILCERRLPEGNSTDSGAGPSREKRLIIDNKTLMSSFRPHILIADDEEGIRFSLCQLLRKEGYVVEEAVDGEEAVEKIRRALFDLVILDMRMPRKDGLTALREIKRLQPNVIVLVITAFGTRQTAHQVISEGAYD